MTFEVHKGRAVSFTLFFLLFLSFCISPAQGSLLTSFAPPDNPVESQPDFTLPALLLNQKKKKITYMFQYDDTYKVTLQGKTQNLIYVYENAVSVLLPHAFKKGKAVLGFQKTFSKIHLFTNNKIQNTEINARGNGNTVSAAVSYKNLSFGYFTSVSASSGEGFSNEIKQNIDIFSSDTRALTRGGVKTKGFQYGLCDKRFAVYYQRNTFRMPLNLTLADADDNFYLPVEIHGKSSRYDFFGNYKNVSLSYFYQRGSGGSMDTFYYNHSPTLGAHLSTSAFKKRGFSMNRNKITLGYEEYNGNLKGAASIDIISSFFGLIGGYYLLHYNAEASYNKYLAGYATDFKKTSFYAQYFLTFFNVSAHFDGAQKFFLGLVEKNKTVKEFNIKHGKLHSLTLGLKREIRKNFSLGYSITQFIPQIKKEETQKIEHFSGGGTEAEKSNIKGGTLHTLSIEYFF